MTTTNKTTNRSALNYALDNLPNAPQEIRDKWLAMIASLDKRAAAPKKMTPVQQENEVTKAVITDFLNDNADAGFTCADLAKQVAELNGLSPQKISALMRQLKEAGIVDTYTEKRRTYFRAVQ